MQEEPPSSQDTDLDVDGAKVESRLLVNNTATLEDDAGPSLVSGPTAIGDGEPQGSPAEVPTIRLSLAAPPVQPPPPSEAATPTSFIGIGGQQPARSRGCYSDLIHWDRWSAASTIKGGVPNKRYLLRTQTRPPERLSGAKLGASLL